MSLVLVQSLESVPCWIWNIVRIQRSEAFAPAPYIASGSIRVNGFAVVQVQLFQIQLAHISDDLIYKCFRKTVLIMTTQVQFRKARLGTRLFTGAARDYGRYR